MTTLVSIIVPVYNKEKYLEECLKSILAQTLNAFEVIIVNDGSTDSSAKICEEYAKKDSRIKVIHNRRKGVSAARNTGLDFATGEFVGWVDADDYIEPDMFQSLYNLATEHNADIAECNYATLSAEAIVPGDFGKGIESGGRDLLIEKYLSADIFYGIVTKLFRRSLFRDIRFPEGRIFEDTRMTIWFCLEDIKYVRNPVVKYYYRQTESSIIRTDITRQRAREYIYLLDDKMDLVRKKVNDDELFSRCRTLINEESVLWYLNLVSAKDRVINKIYATLFHHLMNYSMTECLMSHRIPVRNKISYLLTSARFGFLISVLKKTFR